MLSLDVMINSNIEYFWDADPSIWCDDGRFKEEPTIINNDNVKKIWSYFKDWCFMDCKETYEQMGEFIEESVIAKKIDDSYENWLNWQKKIYPNRVCV